MGVRYGAALLGVGLILFPDPATTGVGLIITASAIGMESVAKAAASGDV